MQNPRREDTPAQGWDRTDQTEWHRQTAPTMRALTPIGMTVMVIAFAVAAIANAGTTISHTAGVFLIVGAVTALAGLRKSNR